MCEALSQFSATHTYIMQKEDTLLLQIEFRENPKLVLTESTKQSLLIGFGSHKGHQRMVSFCAVQVLLCIEMHFQKDACSPKPW